jgi:tight adherence protein B
MDFETFTRIGFYVCVAVAVIFLVEAVYFAIAQPLTRKRSVNRRLQVMKDAHGAEALESLLQERGINSNMNGQIGALHRLLMQSGLRVTLRKFMTLSALAFAGIYAALAFATTLPRLYALLAAFALGVLLPIQIVRFMRSSRQTKFSSQLPDALDVIVRSLRSGHPVPVAMSMVGREMPDPVGSEFGLTIDEMTYGLDMQGALQNLNERVGVADLSLLVTAVSLQQGSGGNLSEVLSNLSKVLRDRFQLRRKVRSLSAEGRFSGWGLAVLPALIAAAIYAQNPEYYLDVWEEPLFLPGMGALLVWSLFGDLIMYKMINFKY